MGKNQRTKEELTYCVQNRLGSSFLGKIVGLILLEANKMKTESSLASSKMKTESSYIGWYHQSGTSSIPRIITNQVIREYPPKQSKEQQ